MDFDETKVDEAVLALLWLTRFREKKDWPWRTWKGHDWEAMNRLHEAGFISDPRNKNKSVGFTEEGERRAEELFCEAVREGGRELTGRPAATRTFACGVDESVKTAPIFKRKAFRLIMDFLN